MPSAKSRSPKEKRRLRAGEKLSGFKNPNRIPLGENRLKEKKKKRPELKKPDGPASLVSNATASQQLEFFIDRFESANGVKLSSLELEGLKETSTVELSPAVDQDAANLSKHLKFALGNSWEEVLCEDQLVEGKIEGGNPAVLVVCSSAIRSLELLRGSRSLTKKCRAAKLFAKHLKVDEQVSSLKGRVNIAFGTPNRIKKLIDMDVLGLSRIAVLVFDMHTDAKGYSLFTLPQVRDEFWDLYKSHFHRQLLRGELRICLYGQNLSKDIKDVNSSED